MITTLWSVKGGSGVSVVAAAIAAVESGRGGALLVDLVGDQPAVLGLAEPDGPGVRDWLATPTGDADALARLCVPVHDGLRLLPAGSTTGWPAERGAPLVGALEEVARRSAGAVVVDGGLGAPPVGELAAAGASLLVLRPCYLALRRAVRSEIRADGVVLVEEVGRSLDRHDVARVLGLPVLTSVLADPAVARAVDAGLLTGRVPRLLERSLRAVT